MKIDLRKVPFYYLNLESQPERREKMEKLLSSLELEEYSRIEAIHNDWGHLGCSQSFAESLAILKKRGGPFVFLEDDVDFTPVQFWNFTWSDDKGRLPYDWD